MNWKPTWVLLLAAAVLLAFIVLVEQPMRRQRELQESRLVLPGLNPALVTNIEIHPWGKAMIEAARERGTNGFWRLSRPVTYPGNNQLFAALLDTLAKLEWEIRINEKELSERPDAQADFGFTEPLFTLLLQGSGPDRRVEVGNLGAFNDLVSLQVVGNTAIYQAAADILRVLPRDPRLWRNQSLLSLTNVAFQTVRVRSAGQDFELERNATNHLWYMSKPVPPARGDTAKINELLTRLQTVLVSDFVTDDAQADLDTYGQQSTETTPELSISFLDGTNTVAGVQFGHNYTNNTAYAYARRAVQGNIVLVAREPLKVWQAPYTNFLDQHFISLPPSLITSITVHGGDDFEVSKQTNGQWLVKADKTFPADSILMDYWLAQFTNMPTEIAKRVVTDFSDYGLSHPSLQYTVHFGPNAGAQGDAQIEFGTNQAGKVFERRLDEDFVNTVSSDDFDLLPRVSWELRDREVWNFASKNVVSVTINQRGGVLKYLRDPDGNWTYAPGFNNQVPINSFATEACVFEIAHLHAIYWDGVGEDHLERFGFPQADFEVAFEVKQGGTNETYRLKFGARSPTHYHPYASVVKDGQRLIFEFPAGLYDNLVEPNLTLYTARIQHR
ncbi:MAG TPA: DUF4340 domain-containing protein [Verrucomicrobiae bacterium]|jgi:hypothetical protein|nr:DUF4340 domain-containing protein [Verrucomicrobiae bacterium]